MATVVNRRDTFYIGLDLLIICRKPILITPLTRRMGLTYRATVKVLGMLEQHGFVEKRFGKSRKGASYSRSYIKRKSRWWYKTTVRGERLIRKSEKLINMGILKPRNLISFNFAGGNIRDHLKAWTPAPISRWLTEEEGGFPEDFHNSIMIQVKPE